MNIIFGKEQFETMSGKYTLLELDTFQIGTDSEPITAYCAVENISPEDLLQIDELKIKHADMIKHYQARQWDQCQHILEELHGKWNGELDSFYQEIDFRTHKFTEEDPGANWSYIIVK